MKISHNSIIILITTILLFSMIHFASQSVFVNGQTYHPTLEDQFGNTTQTKLAHDNAALILNQTAIDLKFKSGENMTIIPELINMGNKTVDIAHWQPWVVLEIKDHDGRVVWPESDLVAFIPEFHGVTTIKPGEHLSEHPWGNGIEPLRLFVPGNYTVVSVALFTFDTHTESLKSMQPLWSKPLQITILPEKYVQNKTGSAMPKIPEFPFAVVILLISFVSVIVFYKIKSIK